MSFGRIIWARSGMLRATASSVSNNKCADDCREWKKRWRMRKRKQKHKKNFYLHFASEFSDLSACLLFAARLIPKPVPPFINIRERTQINNKASKYESSLFGCAKMLIKIWFCLSANNRQRQAEWYWVSVRSADGREWKADGPHKK